jgi:hypothetical protein
MAYQLVSGERSEIDVGSEEVTVGMDTREDLALLRGRELRADAAARRLARDARASVRPCSGSLRTALGAGLVRAGLRLGGEPPVSSLGAAIRRCR